MNLPNFHPGQFLKASDLQTLADAIADLQTRVQEQTLSLSDDFEVERTPSGTCLSLVGGHARGNAASQSHTRYPFEIYVKTNATGRQTAYCDGNVAEQHYEVVDKNGGAEIELTGWRQFGVANSHTIEKGFAGTLYFYLRHNQTGETGTGIVIKDNGYQGDNELFIGNIKFDGKGGYKITQVWIGGYSFTRIDPNQIPAPNWSKCPRYNSH